MIEKDFKKPWDIFSVYLDLSIDFLESFEEDFEAQTLRDNLFEIACHIDSKKEFLKKKKKPKTL